ALVGSVACLLAIDYDAARLLRLTGLLPGLLCLSTTLKESLGEAEATAGSFAPPPAASWIRPLKTSFIWLFDPHGLGFDSYFVLGWLGALGFCFLLTLRQAYLELRRGVAPAQVLRENRWLILALLLLPGMFLAPPQLKDWYHVRSRFA